MVKRACYVVDAFSDRPLAGNSAGVVFDAEALDTAELQRIAEELKHAETAFPLPAREPQAAFHLRWFTTFCEVGFCGHATLAALHALVEDAKRIRVDSEGVTRIGSRNMFMACSHVAHDCVIGDGVVLANNVLLAGHVHVEDGGWEFADGDFGSPIMVNWHWPPGYTANSVNVVDPSTGVSDKADVWRVHTATENRVKTATDWRAHVLNHPEKAMAAAFGGGLVLAMLLPTRSAHSSRSAANGLIMVGQTTWR